MFRIANSDREPFDWYQSYNELKHILDPKHLAQSFSKSGGDVEVEHLKQCEIDYATNKPSDDGQKFPLKHHCRVLIIGCGNSRLGEEMLIDGWFGGISNVDYSSVAISQMREKYSEVFYSKLQARFEREKRELCESTSNKKKEESLSNDDMLVAGVTKSELSCVADEKNENSKKTILKMIYECADASKGIPFPNASFDLILCKGTLDAILCSSGSIANVRRMMEECARVLDKKHGVMVTVTYGNPDNRIRYFENEGNEWWGGGIHTQTVPKCIDVVNPDNREKNHYVYICKTAGSLARRNGQEITGGSEKTNDAIAAVALAFSDEENSSDPCLANAKITHGVCALASNEKARGISNDKTPKMKNTLIK